MVGFVPQSVPSHLALMITLWLLPTDETALLMSDVAHIPQTAASHTSTLGGPLGVEADMLKDDPRDTFYHGKAMS